MWLSGIFVVQILYPLDCADGFCGSVFVGTAVIPHHSGLLAHGGVENGQILHIAVWSGTDDNGTISLFPPRPLLPLIPPVNKIIK